MRRLRIYIGVVAIALSTGAAAATNLGANGYPGPNCGDKPVKPVRPAKVDTQAVADAYNKKVEAYNKGMKDYVTCVQHYVDAAADDMKQIRALIEKTIQAANATQ